MENEIVKKFDIGVFGIFDEKAEVFDPPFFIPTNGMAIRWFGELVNDKNTKFNRHPSDYKLYRIASFDNRLAKFECLDIPSLLSNGIEHIKSEVKNA